MTRKVHVLAFEDDPHALALSWALERMGVQVVLSTGLAQWRGREVGIEIDRAWTRRATRHGRRAYLSMESAAASAEIKAQFAAR